MRAGCVILASGTSSRFGTNKLLMDFRGVPLFEWTLRAIPRDVFACAAVVTPYEPIMQRAGELGFACVTNPDPNAGPGLTTKLGLRALLDSNLDACMFCVCDQPYLSPSSLRGMVSAFDSGMLALSWNRKRGNPVLFAEEYFKQLLDLPDDKGGSAVIRQHTDMLEMYEAECALELADTDRQDTFGRLQRTPNFFLTGAKGTGKSTLLRTYLDARGSVRTGFRTLPYMIEGHHAGHYLHALSPKVLLDENDKPVSIYAPPGCIGVPEVFDRYGSRYVQLALQDDSRLIEMDELGFLEQNAEAFKAQVTAALDSDRPLAGVMRDDKRGWLRDIRSRHDTLVVRVDPSFRHEASWQLERFLDAMVP